jgi:hypothetical protein
MGSELREIGQILHFFSAWQIGSPLFTAGKRRENRSPSEWRGRQESPSRSRSHLCSNPPLVGWNDGDLHCDER